MAKTIVSVSKKNNSVWRIYFYDTNEEGKYYFGTQRINPLLILYYKLKKSSLYRDIFVLPDLSIFYGQIWNRG